MTRRGRVLTGAAVLLLIGCAQPGTSSVDSVDEEVLPSPALSLPTENVADCFDTTAEVSAAPSAAEPSARQTGPDDQFERNQRANNAFRNRVELPMAYHVAAKPCVEQVRDELDKLHAVADYEPASVEDALRRVGLADVYARPPGRLDLGRGDGVVFSASPGPGCIVGHHSTDGPIVEYGGMIRDGGCLVAPG